MTTAQQQKLVALPLLKTGLVTVREAMEANDEHFAHREHRLSQGESVREGGERAARVGCVGWVCKGPQSEGVGVRARG